MFLIYHAIDWHRNDPARCINSQNSRWISHNNVLYFQHNYLIQRDEEEKRREENAWMNAFDDDVVDAIDPVGQPKRVFISTRAFATSSASSSSFSVNV